MLITTAELEFTSLREPFKRDLTHSKIQRGRCGVADVYRHDIRRSVRYDGKGLQEIVQLSSPLIMLETLSQFTYFT